MTSQSDPTDPTLLQQKRMQEGYENFVRTTSYSLLVIAPILIALPPRKLDLYTFALTGAFIGSASYVSKDRTGKSLFAHVPGFRQQAMDFEEKREKSQQELFQESLQARKRLLEEEVAPSLVAQPVVTGRNNHDAKTPKSLIEAKAKEIWMGGETEGWKERRLKEEQEKISAGEGYGDLIADQIWEVWNWGEKKAEKLKAKDEKVLAEKRRDEEFPKIGKE